MRKFISSVLRNLANRLDPPPPDWCDLVVALKMEHKESVESARIRHGIHLAGHDFSIKDNVIRLRR